MSGGSFDYGYQNLDRYYHRMEDDELYDMMVDVSELLRQFELYRSVDTVEDSYLEY